MFTQVELDVDVQVLGGATATLVRSRSVGSNFDVGRPWVCQVGGATINLINLTLVSCQLLFWEFQTDIII